MSKRALASSVAVIFALALGSVHALGCSCFQIDEGNEQPCVGDGCNSYYIPNYFGFGCIYGECYTAGYGQCCDKSYKLYNIDTGGCDGEDCGECGQARVHGSSNSARLGQVVPESLGVVARLRTDAAFNAGNAFETGRFSEEILFIPDRCRHTYVALYPQDRARRKNSVANSRPTRVPPGGGL